MSYDIWIAEERRARLIFMKASDDFWERAIFRVCSDCGEVLLCHEKECTNCGSHEIVRKKLYIHDEDQFARRRIRCKKRFEDRGK